MAIRACTARSVVLYMKQGMSVEEACYEAADDYRGLSGGVIRRVVIHAIDSKGNHCVLCAGSEEAVPYYLWDEAKDAFEELESAVVHL
jgi:L-asparaginase